MKQKILNPGRVLPLALLVTVSLAGCSESATAPESKQAAAPQAQQATTASQAAATPAQNKGVVKSNQVAGGYSYLEVDVEGQIFWLATAISSVKPGDSIAWKDFAMMQNFKSKSLNREFAQVLFVDRIITDGDQAARVNSGTVIESMNSAGYSYIHVEQNGSRVWLAAPETAINVGQSISWNGGAPMRNFNSQSLNRVFDEIYFVSAVQGS